MMTARMHLDVMQTSLQHSSATRDAGATMSAGEGKPFLLKQGELHKSLNWITRDIEWYGWQQHAHGDGFVWRRARFQPISSVDMGFHIKHSLRSMQKGVMNRPKLAFKVRTNINEEDRLGVGDRLLRFMGWIGNEMVTPSGRFMDLERWQTDYPVRTGKLIVGRLPAQTSEGFKICHCHAPSARHNQINTPNKQITPTPPPTIRVLGQVGDTCDLWRDVVLSYRKALYEWHFFWGVFYDWSCFFWSHFLLEFFAIGPVTFSMTSRMTSDHLRS